MRTRTIAVAAAILVVAGAAAWLLLAGKSDEVAKRDAPQGAAAPVKKRAKSEAPSGAPPRVQLDDDPEGNLVLEGQVVDSDQAPVGGVEVTISSNPRRTATSEEDGSFSFDKLVGRTYQVTAHHHDSVAGPATHRLTETSDPLVLTLRDGARVEVTVVAAASGQPISGATVRLTGGDERTETTDRRGLATFRGVATPWVQVAAKADGYGFASEVVNVLAGSQVTPLRIALRSGAAVEGVVIDEGGKPVEGADVQPEDAASWGSAPAELVGASTNKEGRFRLDGIPAGSFRFTAKKKGFPNATTEPITLDGETTTTGVEIKLAGGATVAGRVVDGSGNAVPWARVTAAKGNSENEWGFEMGNTRATTADQEGHFEFTGLPRSVMTLFAESELATSAFETIDLSADHKQETTLTMTIEGSISGRVQDSAGEPVGDVQVTLAPDFWAGDGNRNFFLRANNSVRTDAGGRFSFGGLPKASYRVRASRSANPMEMWQQEGTKAEVGDTAVVIVLDKNGGIKGRVQFDKGGSPDTFTVVTRWPPGTPVSTDDGTFELAAIAPGTYDITISGADFADHVSRDVEIKPDEITDLGTLTVDRGRIITGRVVAASGSPAKGATVVVGQQVIGDGHTISPALFASMVKKGTTDDNGYFQIIGVTDKAKIAVAEDDSGRSPSVELPPGDANLTLKLGQVGGVKGTVTVDGKPGGGMQILATASAGSSHLLNVVTTAADGSFAYERLAAGEYRLVAMKGGFGTAQASGVAVRVKAGAVATATIDIVTGDVTASVAIAGDGGVAIPSAQVFMFRGTVNPKTGEEVNAAYMSAGAGTQMSFFRGGAPVKFKEVVAEHYSICVIPFSGDMNDPTYQRRLNESRMSLVTHCRPIDVAASPTEQSFSISVPPMPELPE